MNVARPRHANDIHYAQSGSWAPHSLVSRPSCETSCFHGEGLYEGSYTKSLRSYKADTRILLNAVLASGVKMHHDARNGRVATFGKGSLP